MKKSPLFAGLEQFGAQVVGLIMALAISVLLAARLGVGVETDAFLFARRLVTGLTELLSQVLSFFFLPLLVDRLGASGDRYGKEFFNISVKVALMGGALLGVILLAANPIAAFMLPDAGSVQLARSVLYLQVLSAALPAVLIALYFASAVNLGGSFGGPVLLRQLPRAAILMALIFLSADIALNGARAFAFTWYIVAFGFGLWAISVLRKLHLSDGFGSHAKDASTTRPVIFGVSMLLIGIGTQCVLWLETYYAAGLEPGRLTILEFSMRIAGLTGNMLSGALILPIFALWLMKPAGRSFNTVLSLSLTALALLVFLQGFVLVNAGRILDVLYGGGAFSEADRTVMLEVISVLAFAPFSVLMVRMAFIWHLTSDRRFKLLELGVVVAIDVAIRWSIMHNFASPLGLRAIAAGMVIAPLVQAVILMALSLGKGDVNSVVLGPQKRLVIVCLACLVTLLVAQYGAEQLFGAQAQAGSTWAALLIVGISGVAGLVALFGSWKVLCIPFRPKQT